VNAGRNGCEKSGKKSGSGDSSGTSQQGNCKKGQVLDPAQGNQNANTQNPVCMPNDAAKCKKGEVPASRLRDDTTGDNEKVQCVKDIPENKKPKCKPKVEYRFVSIINDKAVYSCKKTRYFEKKKQAKFKDVIQKYQKSYDLQKSDERKKNTENAKRARMGKCLTVVPLAMDMTGTFDPTQYCTDYFDEGFVSSSNAIQWPDDVPWDSSIAVDTTDFTNNWMQEVRAMQPHITCRRRMVCGRAVANTTMVNRKSVDESFDRSLSTERTQGYEDGSSVSLVVRGELEQRQLQVIVEIIDAILAFFRIAVPSMEEILPDMGFFSRLLQLGDRALSIAKAGKSVRSLKDMEDAAKKIQKDTNWKNCLMGKGPK
jgi:hypothetical protein